MFSEPHSPIRFSVLGFIRLTRLWNLIIIVLGQYFTAFFLLDLGDIVLSRSLFLLSLSSVLITAAGYIINDYYDVKIDLINKPERVVVGRILKRRVAMIAHTLLNFAGITLGFFLSFQILSVNLLAAMLLWAYSNRLKRVALVGNFIVAFLTGLSIYVIALHFAPDNIMVIAYALFAFFFTLIREVIKDMEDLKGDTSFGLKTLPVVYGIRKTKNIIYGLSAILLISLCLLFYSMDNMTMIFMSIFLTVPLAFLFYKLDQADTTGQFNRLSNYCKWVMLAGIVSMSLF